MRRSLLFVSFLAVITIIQAVVPPPARSSETNDSTFEFELEAGPVWQSRNDVQIPNTEMGTRFSLIDVVGKGPFFAARLYITWNINNRHSLRALAAPLSISDTGTLGEPVQFNGEVFAAGTPAEATYQFNSWRLSYRYKFFDGQRWNWWVGFTAKVRDAKIELVQAGTSSRKTDLGFVPLLHVSGRYNVTDQWYALLDVDALAGGPGRAEDAAVKIGYDFNDRWSLRVGYRTVEAALRCSVSCVSLLGPRRFRTSSCGASQGLSAVRAGFPI
jgi:hypothetical protein